MKIIQFVFLCLLLTSCLTGERVVSGGPQDETPPQLKKIEKKKNRVILTFNENIQLSDKNNIVTNFKTIPEYKVSQNKLIISDLPLNNQKQIIYFKDGIKDLNENNVLEDYIYASNVGSDTFSLSGNVQTDIKNIENYENCYVLLVPVNTKIEQLLNIYNYNFNKTKLDGTFDLDFIPNPIGMTVFAYIDKNNNTIPDTGDYAGFLYNPIDSNLNPTI